MEILMFALRVEISEYAKKAIEVHSNCIPLWLSLAFTHESMDLRIMDMELRKKVHISLGNSGTFSQSDPKCPIHACIKSNRSCFLPIYDFSNIEFLCSAFWCVKNEINRI